MATCGTRWAYESGCRCDDCREANRHRGLPKMGTDGYMPDKFGNLAVFCWCEARVVAVPVVELRAGSTRSCGDVKCESHNTPLP